MDKRLLLNLPPNRVRRNYSGGALLDRLEGLPAPSDGDRPEDWIASTVQARNPGLEEILNEGLSTVRDRSGNIHLLRDLFAADPAHYLGQKHFDNLGPELGFLTKYLDSGMRLHVQAHPTAEFAQEHLNSRWGKLETYVVLGARKPGEAYLRLGFQRAPGPEEWRRIVMEQDIAAMDACFDRVPVGPGEVWVVPGGLPHAIGEGLLVVEILEPTDLVVRCEFEREGIVVPPDARFMQRDPDFALKIFDHTSYSVAEITRRCRVQPEVLRETAVLTEQRLIGPQETDCFDVRDLRVRGRAELATPGRVMIGMVTEGQGSVRVGGEELEVARGARFLCAAAATEISYTPAAGGDMTVVLCCPGRAALG